MGGRRARVERAAHARRRRHGCPWPAVRPSERDARWLARLQLARPTDALLAAPQEHDLVLALCAREDGRLTAIEEALFHREHRVPLGLEEPGGVTLLVPELKRSGAGGAAHLPGMAAAKTALPVLGVPVQSRVLNGVDSLLSIVQMPAGVPVGTLAIGKSGAKNAGLLAAAILATHDEGLAKRLDAWRSQQTASIGTDPRG